MAYQLLDIMNKISASELAVLFIKQYIFEFGEKKSNEVVNKITSSDKIERLMLNSLNQGRFPNSTETLAVLNTMSYFIFSKGETLCLGGLTVIIQMENTLSVQSEGSIEWECENTPICIDIIMACRNLKINKTNDFFSRFFSEIKKRADNDTPKYSIWDNPDDENDTSFWNTYDGD